MTSPGAARGEPDEPYISPERLAEMEASVGIVPFPPSWVMELIAVVRAARGRPPAGPDDTAACK